MTRNQQICQSCLLKVVWTDLVQKARDAMDTSLGDQQ